MALIDRSGAEVLIPEEKSHEILQEVPQNSVMMRMMRRLPDLSRKTRSIPVLNTLPVAYFVDGDIGYKQTTKQEWGDVKLTAEEIACIVPIPENVLDDSDYDIWGNVKPLITEAIGAAFDKAVLFGINKPAIWPEAIVPGATAAGNCVTLDASVSLYQQLMGEGGVVAKVEEDGYVPNGYIGAITMRSKMRGTLDNNGLPIFGRAVYRDGVQSRSSYELDGNDIFFPPSDVMDASEALLVGGDWTKAIWALRTDITTKLLTESVIQDPNTKEIIYNLAQQDMVALRVKFRAGWALPNNINRYNPDKNTRYPFSVLLPAAPSRAAVPQANSSDPQTSGNDGE